MADPGKTKESKVTVCVCVCVCVIARLLIRISDVVQQVYMNELIKVVGGKARKEACNHSGMEWVFSLVKGGHNAIQADPHIKQFGFTNEHINLLLTPMAILPPTAPTAHTQMFSPNLGWDNMFSLITHNRVVIAWRPLDQWEMMRFVFFFKSSFLQTFILTPHMLRSVLFCPFFQSKGLGLLVC